MVSDQLQLGSTAASRRSLLTIITPAYNEAENLPVLYQRLSEVLYAQHIDWEWVVVDDHSSDQTFETLAGLSQNDPRVRAMRFSRNFGAHIAITCGLHQARGDCAIILAADLQDPPEVVPQLLQHWSNGSQVVWAAREKRKGEKASTVGFSRLYYWLMRHVVGMSQMPAQGADFLLMDRRVIDAFSHFNESNVSILALITWMGFRQSSVTYTKQARLHGRSGWNLEKKLKLLVDSITSFTYVPIRVMSYAGFIFAFAGLAYAALVVINAFRGAPVQGWSSLMMVVLVLGGIQMMMLGVLGEYLWRALDESRHRPRYLIEAVTGPLIAPARSGADVDLNQFVPTEFER